MSLFLFLCDSLIAGDGDQFVNVINRAAAAEVVAGLGEALQHGTDSFGTSQTLDEFVCDVADFEAGEHEGVGLAGDITAGSLAGTHRRHDGGIGLHSCLALPLVEKLRMAVTGSILAMALAVSAVQMAISASCSAVGMGVTAQSAKTMRPLVP